MARQAVPYEKPNLAVLQDGAVFFWHPVFLIVQYIIC